MADLIADTVSVTFWGDGLTKGKWLEWYHDIGIIFQELGYQKTHLDIQSESYTNKKIVSVVRKEKQILPILQNGKVTSMSCFSLPKNYKSASFDYEILAVRQSKYMSIIMNVNDFERVDVNCQISRLIQYIDFQSGEIYQMNRSEMPLIYAAKANPINAFQTLKILSKF